MGKGKVQIVEVAKVDIGPLGQPVDGVLKLKLGQTRAGYVFTMTQSKRAEMSQEQFIQAAQSLGDLVHPHQAVLLVLPDEAPDLKAYKVVAK